MTARTPFVAGNWKMNTTVPVGIELARAVADATPADGVDVAVLPPFTHLARVAQVLDGTHVKVGAQNVYWEAAGAFTGEISAPMLQGLCTHVLVGHSERRNLFGDTDDDVARRLHAALSHDLRVIVAVGETESQRESELTGAVIHRQMDAAFEGVEVADVARIDVAYEPVWAIGTGRTASPDQAQEVCALIRGHLADRFGTAAHGVRILYGGSVTGGNAAELFLQADIDGGLIGGASLKPADFAAIVAAARGSATTKT